MGTLTLIKCFFILPQLGANLSLTGEGPGTILSSVSLLFNPIKFFCLVGWVYLCLDLVQHIQFSPLVPKNYKPIASVATLFLGPILLLLLLIIDVARKFYEGHDSISEILKERLQNASAGVRCLYFGSKDKTSLRLLDSSGRSLTDIYGHGKGQREDSHPLELTEQIVADALEEGASDILIDPKDELTYRIRIRVDGVLRTLKQLEPTVCQAVINSISG